MLSPSKPQEDSVAQRRSCAALWPVVRRICWQLPRADATEPRASPADEQLQADVTKALSNKRFANVTVAVANGIVTLGGTVDLYSDKQDADNRAHHRKNVLGVENQIVVAGPQVEDATLRDKLAKKLAYDRVGYGTTAYNALTIGVQNGVVTLGGVAYGPRDKDSALSLVADYPGVKDVMDNIEVAPDLAEGRPHPHRRGPRHLRCAAAEPLLARSRQADSHHRGQRQRHALRRRRQAERQGCRRHPRQTVPGVFKVTNNLQVASPDANAEK